MKTTRFSALRQQLYAEHPELAEGREERIRELQAAGERHRRTLADLRRARAKTQVDVARILGVEQPQVSRLEKRSDTYLSTLAGYVEALGGRLKLVAVFDDEECEFQLTDLVPEEELANA